MNNRNNLLRPFSLIGLLIIAIGTGGIKPCVSAFGGDQFVRPQQDKQLEQFFSVFYFAVNCGSLISTFISPILREDVHCFGEDSCFPLAFGLPAFLMVVSISKYHNCWDLYLKTESKYMRKFQLFLHPDTEVTKLRNQRVT